MPVFLARSIAAWPAGVISPALVSAATRFLLSPDQRLFGLRGVKICRKKLPSSGMRLLSIQPKQSASSTASSQSSDDRPVCFLA